jgi:hypothetical protein
LSEAAVAVPMYCTNRDCPLATGVTGFKAGLRMVGRSARKVYGVLSRSACSCMCKKQHAWRVYMQGKAKAIDCPGKACADTVHSQLLQLIHLSWLLQASWVEVPIHGSSETTQVCPIPASSINLGGVLHSWCPMHGLLVWKLFLVCHGGLPGTVAGLDHRSRAYTVGTAASTASQNRTMQS